MKRHYTRKTLIKTFAEYGVHLWLILLIASIVSAYAFQFYTRAETPAPEPTTQIAVPAEPASDSATLSPTLPEATVTPQATQAPAATPTPAGPIISLSITLPGIGSETATLDPKRKERKVTVSIYDPNENPNDTRIKPIYTVTKTVTYDANAASPTYGQFINSSADLGAGVKGGKYQIAIKTDQSLNKLVKEKDNALGGQIFDLLPLQVTQIPNQKLITGDIHPIEGDNVMDANDYNDFVSCYSKQASCTDPLIADFDDNGVVEGTDYNLLLLNFQTLVQQGFPAPSLQTTPVAETPTVTIERPTKAAAPTKKAAQTGEQKTAAASSSAGLIVGLIVFALFIGIVVVAFLKRKTIMAIISHKQELTPPEGTTENGEAQPTEQTDATQQEQGEQTGEATEQPVEATPAPETPSTEAPIEQPQDTQPSQPTEIPVEPPAAQPEAVPQPTEAPKEENNTPEQPAPEGGVAANPDEKEYYVKKGRVDDAGAGFWLTLTADSGPIEGHYTGTDAKDGFAMIKGEMKNENGKSYMEVSSMRYED